MKGVLHRRLQEQMQRAWQRGAFKQESLSAVMKKSQRSISEYLRGASQAGALDLDEADVALRHAGGGSLKDFLAGVPMRDLTEEERLVHGLVVRPELVDLVRDLLDVPQTQLPAVIEFVRGAGRLASGPRGARKRGPENGNPPGGRTTPAPKRRR